MRMNEPKYPPRVWLMKCYMKRLLQPGKATQEVPAFSKDTGNGLEHEHDVEYLSLTEHDALLRKARAESQAPAASREELIRGIVTGFNPEGSQEVLFTRIAEEAYDACAAQMQAELAAERAKCAELMEALTALTKKLEHLHRDTKYLEVFADAQLRYGRYTGTTYENELIAAKKALAKYREGEK